MFWTVMVNTGYLLNVSDYLKKMSLKMARIKPNVNLKRLY